MSETSLLSPDDELIKTEIAERSKLYEIKIIQQKKNSKRVKTTAYLDQDIMIKLSKMKAIQGNKRLKKPSWALIINQVLQKGLQND